MQVITMIFLITLSSIIIAGQNSNHLALGQREASNYNSIISGTPIANVTIQSPENKTYYENNVTFEFTIQSSAPPQEFFKGKLFNVFLRHGCALDYNTTNLVNLIENTNLLDQFPNNVPVTLSSLGNNLYEGNATLTNLSQGSHQITVWIRAESDYISYGVPVGSSFTIVSFNVDSIPPKVSIFSPQAKTYNQSSVPLNFLTTKITSAIQYSLDGHGNITIDGNSTLTGLPNGYHNVTVYATDEAGNVGSQTVSFTVEKPQTEIFGSMVIIAVVAIPVVVICLVVGLLLFRRHRKTANLDGLFSIDYFCLLDKLRRKQLS